MGFLKGYLEENRILYTLDFIKYAEKEILENKLSPDTICGYATATKLFDEMVCTRTLYNYIDQCLLKVRNIDLPLRVKLNTKVHRNRKNRRIFGDSIEIRPEQINDRSEFGHWEIDTIVGTIDTSPVLLTLDERTTRYRFIVKIPSRTAKAVNRALRKILKNFGDKAKNIFKSITADNGSEFASLKKAAKHLRIFYAHPYSSYERGTKFADSSPRVQASKKFLHTLYNVCRIG